MKRTHKAFLKKPILQPIRKLFTICIRTNPRPSQAAVLIMANYQKSVIPLNAATIKTNHKNKI